MQRRDFIALAAGASLLPASRAAQEEKEPSPEGRPYRVIDTHLHIFNTNEKLPTHWRGVARRSATVENTVEAMKRGGVDKAFLITYSSVDIARSLPSEVNPVASLPVYSRDYAIKAWKDHPDLFEWFPDHIDPSREGYLEDLERDLEMGAAGVKILSCFHGFLPDHPGLMKAYEVCAKYKKPIIIDGSFWYFDHMPPHKESEVRQKQARTISGYVKTLATVLGAFPNVPISLAHTGTAAEMADYDEIFQTIADHPNASCDVAASTGYSAEWLQTLARSVGAERVMYGSDWPYWAIAGVDSYRKGPRRWRMVTEDCPELSEQEKRWILAENAERFLRNELPHRPTVSQ